MPRSYQEVPVAGGEPFSPQQLAHIEKAIELASEQSGLQFAAYVGPLTDGRDSAARMHADMPEASRSVLVAVDPDARTVDVLTGPDARRWLGDDQCQLAILTMSSRFTVGDIPGGLHDGIVVMGEQAMHPVELFEDEPS